MRPEKLLKTTLALVLVASTSFAHAQGLPTYHSTDNTGKGRQERFEAIESYLKQVAAYSQQLEQRLAKQDDTLIQQLLLKQEQLAREVEQLEGQNQSLRREIELIRGAVGNLSRVDFTQIQDFVNRLEGGEWDQVKQDVEGLKLTTRSLEGIIESMASRPERI